jgi:hypothetical protein
MRDKEARELMAQVERVYEESRSFQLIGIMALDSTHALADETDESERVQIQAKIELWFRHPRLRVDFRPLAIPSGVEDETGPQVTVVDGDYEYTLARGQWSKRKIGWYSPTLREVVGLPPAQVRY